MSLPKINQQKLERERKLSLRCDYCGEHGHTASRCPDKPKTQKRSNNRLPQSHPTLEDILGY